MLVCRIAEKLLYVVQAFRHACMMSSSSISLSSVLVQGVRVLGMCRLECFQLLGVLISRVTKETFQVVKALAHGCVVRVESLQALHVFLLLAMRRHELGVGVLERLQFLRM